MILTEKDSQDLLNKVLALSKAESCTVSVSGSQGRHIRYAQNMATTSGAPRGFSVSVTSNFGTRSATSNTSRMDDNALAAVVADSERLARLAPENPEFMPPLGKQTYGTSTAYSSITANADSKYLASQISPILTQADAAKVQASGFFQSDYGFSAMATSAGLFVYDQATNCSHTITARTGATNGSGWAGSNAVDISKFDLNDQGTTAIQKARDSQNPIEVEPGRFTVILEPSAVADLIGLLLFECDQRSADEGRSFASKGKGATRVGDQIASPLVHLYTDPNDPIAPGGIYSDDGLPSTKVDWIKGGVLKNLQCSRYWAQKNKREPMPTANCLVMAGGTTTTQEMIKQTKRGLLITRFWYIRMVDPQTVTFTGLTRDGVFLIDHGAIYKPTQNFRFNESPVAMLNKVRAMGPSTRTSGSEIGDFPISAPTLLVDDFNLTSISDAV